jgi:anaerobic selenocysteine-containing dehydrogenase
MNTIREKHGPESVVFAMGTGRDIGPWISMLSYAYGSPNVMFSMSGNACYSPRIAAVETVLGDYCVPDASQWLPKRYDDPRYKVPECIIIWGYNIPNTCPDNIFGHWFIDLMKKGTKIICIDPRLSWFASRSKKWLRLRSVTDGALAMGFLHVIINENLFDRSFVEKWTNAAHLIRIDTGKLLRANELVKDESQENFIAWDSKNNTPVVWDSNEVKYKNSNVLPALDGRFEVNHIEGNKVLCHTTWNAFCDEVNQLLYSGGCQ